MPRHWNAEAEQEKEICRREGLVVDTARAFALSLRRLQAAQAESRPRPAMLEPATRALAAAGANVAAAVDRLEAAYRGEFD